MLGILKSEREGQFGDRSHQSRVTKFTELEGSTMKEVKKERRICLQVVPKKQVKVETETEKERERGL